MQIPIPFPSPSSPTPGRVVPTPWGQSRLRGTNFAFSLSLTMNELQLLRYAGKTGNKGRVTCLATLLQNELNSDIARFTTHIKPVLQQIRLLTGLNMGGKTRNIAIQLVLQQCCKKSCTFFVVRFSVPLIKSEVFSSHQKKC